MAVNLATLQDALGNLLAADAAVTAQLGHHNGRIQGAPSAEAQFPYLTIGEDEAADSSTQCVSGERVRAAIVVWTREGGFRQCKAIAAAVKSALDGNLFAVSGHRVVTCHHERSRFMRDLVDGVRQGRLEFTIEIEVDASVV